MKVAPLQAWPWYAPLFAAYPLLYIAASNPGQAGAAIVASFAAIAVAATIAVIVLLRLVLGSWTLAGLGAAWIVFLFYAYGPVNEWWLDVAAAAGESWYGRSPQFLHSLVWLLLMLWGLEGIRRAKGPSARRVSAGLNVAAGVLAGFVLLQSALTLAAGGDREPAPRAISTVTPASTPRPADPDIYFILLDGYARADVLAQYYSHDNRPFLDSLRRRGFQVSESSRSNFTWTFLSLGSALNLDYVQPLLGDTLDPESRDRTEIYRLLRDNRAARFLKQRGYRSVHLQSTWGGTGSNPYADEFVPCHTGVFGREYTRAIADASWLRALSFKLSLDVANCHLRNFETLAAQARTPGPKFVFAHFLPPHHPYLFDRDGNVLRRATISDQFEFQKRLWEDRDSYVEQLLYVNRRIGEVVARLIQDSPRPPVILLVSDHGPNLKGGLGLVEQRWIRLANLTAMYLPGAPADFLPADATPVNHLRRVFNLYFDAGLPILPDRYFASTYDQPFDFEEVAESGESLTSPRSFDKM